MQENKIILTSEAIYDIADIADYIEDEQHSFCQKKSPPHILKENTRMTYYGQQLFNTNHKRHH